MASTALYELFKWHECCSLPFVMKPEKHSPKKLLGQKIGLLTKAQKRTQKEMAKSCNISRIAINRFFVGKSELKAQDLVNVLHTCGIDLEEIIEQKLNNSILPSKTTKPNNPIYQELEVVMENLNLPVRKTLFEQIQWWGKTMRKTPVKEAVLRLEQYTQKLGA